MIFAGAAAAQVVPHVHYHIIPRGTRPEIGARSWTMFGRGQRMDLDDDEAVTLASKMRSELKKVVQEAANLDPEDFQLLGKL